MKQNGNSKRAVRKAALKEKRAAKRRAKRAAYDEAGFFGRTWIIIKRVFCTLLTLFLVALIGVGIYVGIIVLQNSYALTVLNDSSPATEEEILAFAPPDTERGAAIDAMAHYSSDDTWAIYVYLCGSNLESNSISELSDLVKLLTQSKASDYSKESKLADLAALDDFITELAEKGMDLPDYMYLPYTGQSNGIQSGTHLNPLVELLSYLAYALDQTPQKLGNASTDLQEMFAVQLPDNVQIVFQTGGAKSWATAEINPNRIQRFVYNSEGVEFVEELPVRSMGTGETLEDFLRFCKNGYSADHQMILFWNHGGGPFGFCHDEIYSQTLSLSAARQAFENVYPLGESVPFEVIGFDACLMATAEVTKAFQGFGKYLVASEESEPGSGWAHDVWLSALAQDTSINGAQLGKAVVDGFIAANAKDDKTGRVVWNSSNVVTLSVIDIDKAARAYDAYEQFAGKLLADSFKKPAVLSVIGKAAADSVRYGDGDAFNMFNTIDMAVFMDNLCTLYPNEAAAVADAVRDSVLYSRASNYEKDSQGLAIYMPVSIDEMSGLIYYLRYLNDICLSPNVKALYYYKVAGCLNDELSEYADSMGYGVAPIVSNAALKQLPALPLTVETDGNFSVALPQKSAQLVQDVFLEVAGLDDEQVNVRYYGRELCCTIDEDGKLYTDFDGTWLAIDGHMLYAEPISDSASTAKYRCRAMVNNEDSYIIIAYDRDSMNYGILGVSPAVTEEQANTAHRNMKTLEPGNKVAPIYEVDSLDPDQANAFGLELGRSFIYKANSRIGRSSLPDGSYLLSVVIRDARGDEYYTAIIEIKMDDGKVSEIFLREDLYGSRS